jgi:undecaprenyl-diphosphatase
VPSELERLEHDAVADPSRSLTVRSRGLVYAVAGLLLLLAVVLAALRVGEQAGRLSDWQALVLGITQGASELLPISSSGHLILVPWIADWHYLEQNPGFNKTFDVSLHLGTLVAVVVYFWRDVVRYTLAWLHSVRAVAVRDADERLSWAIAIATVPAALVGALGEDTIDEHLGQPWQIAFFLAFFAGLLWVADRSPQRGSLDRLTLRAAVAIGVSQILALMPGVSRSGITITTGRFARLDRDAAARFSFLLLIPVVLGAVVWKGLNDVVLEPLPAVRALPTRPRSADRARDRRRLAGRELLDPLRKRVAPRARPTGRRIVTRACRSPGRTCARADPRLRARRAAGTARSARLRAHHEASP